MVVGIVVLTISVDVLSNVVDIKLVKIIVEVVLNDLQTAAPQQWGNRLTDMSRLSWSSPYW